VQTPAGYRQRLSLKKVAGLVSHNLKKGNWHIKSILSDINGSGHFIEIRGFRMRGRDSQNNDKLEKKETNPAGEIFHAVITVLYWRNVQCEDFFRLYYDYNVIIRKRWRYEQA
jgi:hypothetical protein